MIETENVSDLSRDGYNRLIQEAQSTFISFGLEYRIHPVRRGDGSINYATFEVYWDGEWHQIGREWEPMTPKCNRTFNGENYARVVARAVDSVMRS
jgi:hypothetical protein